MLVTLIPVYNNPEGLARSLDSLLVAKRPAGSMVVVVDDGSEPPLVLAERHSVLRVELVRLEVNQGIERALNVGLAHARALGAVFVARLDAGDLVAPDRFERQLELLLGNPDVGLVGSDARFVDEKGDRLFDFEVPTSDGEIRRRMAISSCILHPTAVLRVSALDQVGDYATDYAAAEDYELFLRMLGVCRAAGVPKSLVTIELSRTGISARRRHSQLRSRLRLQIRHFRILEPMSYIGVVSTIALLFIPGSVVSSLKRWVGKTRY